MWYKQNYVPHVPQMWYKMWYKLGFMGEIQYKYRKYVPQNGVQKNYVPHVPQIGVQFGVQIRVHGRNLTTKL